MDAAAEGETTATDGPEEVDGTAEAGGTTTAADATATADGTAVPAEIAEWNIKMQKAQAAAADGTADGKDVAEALDVLCKAAGSMGVDVLTAGAAQDVVSQANTERREIEQIFFVGSRPHCWAAKSGIELVGRECSEIGPSETCGTAEADKSSGGTER